MLVGRLGRLIEHIDLFNVYLMFVYSLNRLGVMAAWPGSRLEAMAQGRGCRLKTIVNQHT